LAYSDKTLIKVGTKLPTSSNFNMSANRGTVPYGNSDGNNYYAGEATFLGFVQNPSNWFDTISEENVYSVYCAYSFARGAKIYDNKNNESDIPQYPGGNIKSNTISITAVYPIYVNNINIGNMNECELMDYNSSCVKVVNIPNENDGDWTNKFRIYVPDSVKISSVMMFNSISGEYDINVTMYKMGTEIFNDKTYITYSRYVKDTDTINQSAKYKITIVKK